MNKELKAINVLIHERECVTRASTEGCDRNCENCDLVLPEEDIIEAYDLAISALSQPQGDTISRQAAIDTVEKWLECKDYNETERHIMRATQSMLYDLPSSQPDIEAIRQEIEKQKIMVSGSFLTKDQQDVFRNAINVALAVIDKHIQKGENK